MLDLISIVALALAIASLGSLILLLRYLPTLRKAASSYEDSSSVISHVIGELDSRASMQDRRLADVQVKLDVLEERWLRSGWMSSQAPREYVQQMTRYATSQTASASSPTPSELELQQMLSRNTSRLLRQNPKPSKVEILVLKRLVEGSLTAPNVKDILGSSREHAARVMKALTDKGLVVRDPSKRPYTYEISDIGRDMVTKS